MPVRQPTPGPSATTGLNVLQPFKSKKRTAIDLAVDDETRHTKKHKKDLGLTTGGTSDNIVPTDTHPREKENKKKRKKKKRKSPLTAQDYDHERDATEMKVKRATTTPQPVNLAAMTQLPDTLSKNESFTSRVATRSESDKSAIREDVDTSSPRVRPPFQFSSNPVTQSVASDDDKSVSKGKGRAKSTAIDQIVPSGPISSSGLSLESSLSEAQARIAELSLQLESQKKLVSRHEDNLSHLQQSLTCEICLDLLYKPFALSPCGHIVCYMCLIRWFTSVQSNNGNGNGSANVNLISEPDDIPRILGSQQATRGIYLRKRKTCPLCRAAVTDRPAEVWSIKSMVVNLVKSKLVDLPSLPPPSPDTPHDDTTSNGQGRDKHDPWRNIFSKRRGGGGFNDYALPRIYPAPPAHVEGEGGGLEDMGMYDAEDGGIYRCLDCMHEIWGGFCTSCDRQYPGHLRLHIEDDDDDDNDDASGSEHSHGNAARNFLGRRLRQIWDGYLEDGGGWAPEDDEDDLERDEDLDMYMELRQYAPIGTFSADEDESEEDFASHASGSLDGGFSESGSATDSYEENEDGRSWVSSESHDGSHADVDDPYLHAHRLAIESYMDNVPNWPFGRSFSPPPEDGSAHIEEVENDDGDEPYESSFIDDEEEGNSHHNQDLVDLDPEDSDAEAEAEAIAARWWGRQLRSRRRREPTVLISDNELEVDDDDDNDDDGEAGVRAVRRRRGRARVMVGEISD